MIAVIEWILLIAAAALQGTLLPHFTFQGARLDLVLAVVVCMGLSGGIARGGLAGLTAGLLIDSLFTNGLGLYALLYLCCGLAGGVLCAESPWLQSDTGFAAVTRGVIMADKGDRRRRQFSERVLRPLAATVVAASIKELAVIAIAFFSGVGMRLTDMPVRVATTAALCAGCALVLTQVFSLARAPRRKGIF